MESKQINVTMDQYAIESSIVTTMLEILSVFFHRVEDMKNVIQVELLFPSNYEPKAVRLLIVQRLVMCEKQNDRVAVKERQHIAPNGREQCEFSPGRV